MTETPLPSLVRSTFEVGAYEAGKVQLWRSIVMRRSYRRALVTGATSGIGEAFARELAPSTDVLLTGRDTVRLAELARELGRPGRKVETLAADLSLEADVLRVANWAEGHGVDLLVNSAGVGHLGKIVDHSVADERDIVAVNVTALLLLTRLLIPGMMERARDRGGRAAVIIVSSTVAFSAVPYFATYAATKSFGLSFAEALGEEMRGEPLDVLALCPGATRTAFGSRAGFGERRIPGAADPRTVARDGLRALGRQPVKVSGVVDQAALGPLVLRRCALTGVVGTAMRVLTRSLSRPVGHGTSRPERALP